MPPIDLDIVYCLAQHLASAEQYATLASLLTLSRPAYGLVLPLLYRRLSISRSNAEQIKRGLACPSASSQSTTSHAARKGRSTGKISWSEFMSNDHYLDWAAAVDWGHNENLRFRREYLVWPDADAESSPEPSDDELDFAVDDDPLERLSKVEAYYYPNIESHRRKTAALAHTRSLHIVSVPSLHTSHQLALLSRRVALGFMPRLSHLSISPAAYFALVDWEDRHPLSSHPFRRFLETLRPSHLCVTYPAVDARLERTYMSNRIVSVDEHLCRSWAVDQYTYLRNMLQSLLLQTFGNIMQSLLEAWASDAARTGRTPLESLEIHGVAREALPNLCEVLGEKKGFKTSTPAPRRPRTRVRVWFRPCPCDDPDVVDKVQDTSCYSHWSFEGRTMEVMMMLADALPAPLPPSRRGSKDSSRSARAERRTSEVEVSEEQAADDVLVELVDMDWTLGTAQMPLRVPGAERLFWEKVEEGMSPEVAGEIKRRVRLVHGGEQGVMCRCCGRGQTR